MPVRGVRESLRVNNGAFCRAAAVARVQNGGCHRATRTDRHRRLRRLLTIKKIKKYTYIYFIIVVVVVAIKKTLNQVSSIVMFYWPSFEKTYTSTQWRVYGFHPRGISKEKNMFFVVGRTLPVRSTSILLIVYLEPGSLLNPGRTTEGSP